MVRDLDHVERDLLPAGGDEFLQELLSAPADELHFDPGLCHRRPDFLADPDFPGAREGRNPDLGPVEHLRLGRGFLRQAVAECKCETQHANGDEHSFD